MTHRTNPVDDYASYLIRFWRETEDEGLMPWQAQIESIQTGQSWHCANLDALVDFFNGTFPPADPSEKR